MNLSHADFADLLIKSCLCAIREIISVLCVLKKNSHNSILEKSSADVQA